MADRTELVRLVTLAARRIGSRRAVQWGATVVGGGRYAKRALERLRAAARG